MLRLPAVTLPVVFGSLVLSGCASTSRSLSSTAPPIAVKIIAFNDFHGNLAPPKLYIETAGPEGGRKVPAGGAAYLATAIGQLKAQSPNSIVVSAGDLISASPLVSSLFLDEPTIAAMNIAGLDINAVGNHEFDRGVDELQRMQQGGCAKFTQRQPCRVERFTGARFAFLAANSIRPNGKTLFAPYAIRSFGKGASRIRIGFIGMTLKGTGDIVNPAGLKGVHFADEAATANKLIPKLRAKGVNSLVVVIHQGGTTTAAHGDKSCAGLSGDIIPILEALDPSVDVVISGHTHKDYVCDYGRLNPARPFLLTSAGQYGTLLSDIKLTFDGRSQKLIAKSADNLIVQGEGFTTSKSVEVALTDAAPRYAPEPRVAALVQRYTAASETLAARKVARLAQPILRKSNDAGEQPLGNLIADAQLEALRPASAQFAIMNAGGVRADLVPTADGDLTFGAIYSVQPFGNELVVKHLTGQQIRDALEVALTEVPAPGATPRLPLPSANLHYRYDYGRPVGSRLIALTLDGNPVESSGSYRVAMSKFLGDGGDGFVSFKPGPVIATGLIDLDALERYLAAHPDIVPTMGRIGRN